MALLGNTFKRFLRSRLVFIWLIILFIVYIIINNFFLNWASSSSALSIDAQNKLDSFRLIGVPKQIEVIKDRINNLQKSLDRSKQDAEDLNGLMRKAYSEIKNDKSAAAAAAPIVLPVVVPAPATESKEKIDSVAPQKKTLTSDDQDDSTKIAILVFSCNRPTSVENHLKQLIEKRAASGKVNKFPIIVSQDCGDEATAKTIEKYSKDLFASLKQPDLSDITVDKKTGEDIKPHLKGYYKIARHYKWALEQVFEKYKFQGVIITEDDLNIAVDFFDYFNAMHKVLVKDSTIYCVSAWNDNGKKDLIDTERPDLVHRSDFFPGLGWMMLRSLWFELRTKWPYGYWDDWMRETTQRKNRVCLRPEISRTEIAGDEAKKGVSNGQFFDKFLRLINVNTKSVAWSSLNNTYLLKENYDKMFLNEIYNKSIEMSYNDYLVNQKDLPKNKVPILITYQNKEEFVKYANFFAIMDDFKAGVPRTGYMGVVRIFYDKRTIYIAPSQKLSWSSYPQDW